MLSERIKIAPSILSADFSNLKSQIKMVEEAGADLIHIDVMDGHFVPNITVGPMIVKAVNDITDLPLDVHLMISNPDFFLSEFVNSGADYISVHFETCSHLHQTVKKIKSFKKVKAGVAINPNTSITNLEDILPELDFVLVMSVNPGFSGQLFITNTLEKISSMKKMINERKLLVEIEVDGGINPKNAKEVIKAGATILVAGNSIFKQKDIQSAVRAFKRLEV